MVSPANMKQNKGWFTGVIPGRDGDRSLEQQMTGLEQLFAEAPGKRVLDAGCAEGLISIELVKRGASICLGLEIVPGHVALARDMTNGLHCVFKVADLNEYDIAALQQFDIVLMLAILHKLKDPSAVCAALASKANDLCVIRLPPSGPVIIDARSGDVPHDIHAVMESAGFTLENVVEGPMEEWLGYFRRAAPTQEDAMPPAKLRAEDVAQLEQTVNAPEDVAKTFQVPEAEALGAAATAVASDERPTKPEGDAGGQPQSDGESEGGEEAPVEPVSTTSAEAISPVANVTGARRGGRQKSTVKES